MLSEKLLSCALLGIDPVLLDVGFYECDRCWGDDRAFFWHLAQFKKIIK